MSFNPSVTGRLYHCYMLDESACHFRGVGSILLLLFLFDGKFLLANTEEPDQMPHYMASNLGLHWLSITLLWVSRYEWVTLYQEKKL